MHQLKLRKFWLTIGLLLIALIWYLSLTPKPLPDMGMDNSDKLGHFLAYGLLMGWYAQLYHHFKPRMILLVSFILMGIIIEFIQGMTDYRSFQYADMLADAAGVLLAILIARGQLSQLLVNFEKRFLP